MKTNLLRNTALAATVAIASILSTAAYAGPGPQYWSGRAKNASKPAKTSTAVPICPGSKEVAVTAMKPAWQNGRGPLTETKIGTKRVCTVCPVTDASGAVAAAGTQHDCNVNCQPPKA